MTKETTIIEAATHLFLDHGFGGTSMDAIAREAGTAKQTVYNYFDSKETLFMAIVQNRCTTLFDELPDDKKQENIEAYLTALGNRLMDMLFIEETMELYRLVLAETPRFPDLGRTYYEAGPQVAVDTLAAFFENHGISKDKGTPLAAQFFGMLTGHLLTKALLNKNYKPGKREKQKQLESTVPLFAAYIREQR